MHCRIFSSILGVFQNMPMATPPPPLKTNYVSRFAKCPPGSKIIPTAVDKELAFFFFSVKGQRDEYFRLCGPKVVSITYFSSLKTPPLF